MSGPASLMQAIAKGTLWNYTIFALSKGGMFLSTLVLARLLAPEDFGLLALGLLAVSYLETLSDCGVGAALIYRQEDPDRSSSVAFHLNMAISLLLAILTYYLAPLAAEFFGETRLTPIIQVLGCSFILSGLRNVHESRLRKQLNFRQRLTPELGKTLIKGLVSILLAIYGFGVWSLVWGQLCGAVVSTALYWRASSWRPTLDFDIRIARALLSYGLHIVLVGILGLLSKNIDVLFIGRRLDTLQLGYYTMALQLPQFAIISVCHIVSQSLFPAYSKLQHDREALRSTFILSLRYLSILIVPIGVGLCFVAPQFIQVFYSERWLAIIPIVQLLAINALLTALSFNVGDLYKATGRPSILNKISLMRIPFSLPLLWLAAGHTIHTVAAAQVGITLILTTVQFVIASRILTVNVTTILGTLIPAFSGASAMLLGLVILRHQMMDLSTPTMLCLLVLGGILLYSATIAYIDRTLLVQIKTFLRNTPSPSQPASPTRLEPAELATVNHTNSHR